MRSFNVLDPTESIFGQKILEASAGTGKTFTIEHLVARLLKEAPEGETPLKLDQILVITFTRAAARELRMRIYATLKKEKLSFQGEQIFTIHGFCQKTLMRSGLILDQEPKERIKMQSALLQFLKKQEVLCPQQLGILLIRKDAYELCNELLQAPCPERGKTFAEMQKVFEETLKRAPGSPEEFFLIRDQYKISGFKRDELEEQAALLEKGDFKSLISYRNSLFDYLSLENQKVRLKEKASSSYFDWALRELAPTLEEATDPKRLFKNLRFAAEPLMEEEEFFSHELLLQRCWKASADPTFCEAVREQYKAVIIDEFQDTDALQWEIIDRLFRGSSRLFCLVGDPKQSIYRFRKADLYSYFRARSLVGDEACYSLDTNYRSSSQLLSALNDFFRDEHVERWLLLPREKRACSYLPLKAGVKISSPFSGAALRFFTGDPLPYVASEIAKLKKSSVAILVKDHREAAEVQDFLEQRGISSVLKNTKPLGKTFAARAWEELFDALYDPTRKKPFLLGPFSDSSLCEWRDLLEQEGLPSLLRAAVPQESSFLQVAELLMEIRFPTFEKIKRFFRRLETEEVLCRAELEEEGTVRILTMHASKGLEFDVVFALGVIRASPKEGDDLEEQEAEKMRQLYVALTRAKWRLYIPLSEMGKNSPLALFLARSKLGSDPLQIIERLAAINPEIQLDESIPDEPVVRRNPAPSGAGLGERSFDLESAKGAPDPCRKKNLPPFSEEGVLQVPLVKKKEGERVPEMKRTFPPAKSKMYSFTSLAKPKEAPIAGCSVGEPSLHTLPRGIELGVSLHRIFERIFSEKKNPKEIVSEEALFHSLTEWEQALQEMVTKVLQLPFLAEAKWTRPEVEFLFSQAPHYLKGFIDLLFLWEGRLYFLDWKTNWLGVDDSVYGEESLRRAMEAHDYWLQASLYTEALQRSFPHLPWGGAFYLFLRGIHSEGRGVLKV